MRHTSCTLQKRSFSPLQFDQEEKMPGHSIESRTYWFVLKISRVFPIPTGRVGIGWWTIFTIVIITPTCKWYLENLLYFVLNSPTLTPTDPWSSLYFDGKNMRRKCQMNNFPIATRVLLKPPTTDPSTTNPLTHWPFTTYPPTHRPLTRQLTLKR